MQSRMKLLVVGPLSVVDSWKEAVAHCTLGFEPWKHQETIAESIVNRVGSAIFAEMATGKTLATLLGFGLRGVDCDFLDLTRGATRRRAENLEIAVAKQTRPMVVYVNHDSAWRDALRTVIDRQRWEGIVIDESHRIKSPGSKVSRWAGSLVKKHPNAKRVALTGTPCPQSPLDLYAQYRFIDPGVFGTSFASFRSKVAVFHPQFASKVTRYLPEGVKWLKATVDKTSVQVRADDVIDLPEAIHRKVSVELSPKTKGYYKSLEDEMTAEIAAGTVTVANALVKTLKLRQATSGMARADDSPDVMPIDGIPAKRLALEEFLTDLPLHEPIVVFAQFVADLEEIAAAAKRTNRQYREVSGRKKELDQWEEGIIGVQAQSGGVGIDLSRARIAVFYSVGWSVGEYEQCLARIRRPKQKSNHCLYVHLVARSTIDEIVCRSLRSKQKVVDAVVEGLARQPSRKTA